MWSSSTTTPGYAVWRRSSDIRTAGVREQLDGVRVVALDDEGIVEALVADLDVLGAEGLGDPAEPGLAGQLHLVAELRVRDAVAWSDLVVVAAALRLGRHLDVQPLRWPAMRGCLVHEPGSKPKTKVGGRRLPDQSGGSLRSRRNPDDAADHGNDDEDEEDTHRSSLRLGSTDRSTVGERGTRPSK